MTTVLALPVAVQSSLQDYAEGLRLAEEGMAAADAHADPDWATRVDAAILTLARANEEFSAFDVRRLAGDPPEGTSPNALGARIRTASKRRWIRKVAYLPSPRPSLHAHPIAVWIGWDTPREGELA